MERIDREKRKKQIRKNFIILPIVFSIAAYCILILMGTVVLYPLRDSFDMILFDSEYEFPVTSNEELKNIFAPQTEGLNTSKIDDNFYTVLSSEITYPKYGTCFAHIKIESVGVDAPFYFGDSTLTLNNGVGMYNGSFIPGYGGTVLAAGHNNTYFNGLKNIKKGDIVEITTNYGVCRYKVYETEIVEEQWLYEYAFDLKADYENLVLYTCYPFDELGITEKRFFVRAEYVSGPVIDKYN